MHTFPELYFYLVEFGSKPLSLGDTTNLELPVAVYSTVVGEAKEVEGLWLSFPIKSPAVSGRKAAKSD